MTVGFNIKFGGGSAECRCSRNTLLLLVTILFIFIGFVFIGVNSYKSSHDDHDSIYDDILTLDKDLEHFQEILDSNVETVGQYRDVFNFNTVNKLPQKASDIQRITDANHSKVDKDLEHLQAKIGILVEQMNTNLYRQLQRNYRVANDAAIHRAATDLSGLPNKF